MIDDTERFVASVSKRKVMIALIGAIAGLAIGTALALANPHDLKLLAASLFTALFCGLGVVGAVMQLAHGGEMVRIDHEGVWARGWQKPVPWTAVTRVTIFRLRRWGRYLSLHLNDIDAHPFFRVMTPLTRASRALRLGDVLLSARLSDHDLSDLAVAVDRFAPATVAREFEQLLPSRLD